MKKQTKVFTCRLCGFAGGWAGSILQLAWFPRALADGGPQEPPLHIFKTRGRDELLMGLNPAGGRQGLIVMHDDEKRRRKTVFGKYDGP